MLKAAIKHSSGEDQVRHRIVPAETIQTWVEKLAGLKTETSEILQEEKEEKQVRFSRRNIIRYILTEENNRCEGLKWNLKRDRT